MKLTLNIPESLNEITLNQYQQWLKVADGKSESDFLQQKMIEIFCNISLKQVLQIKATDIDEITNGINKMFESKNKLITTFTHNGIEFGFIPKLDDMAFGEYIDLDTYMSDWQQMHKAMSVLFRPITFKRKEQYLVEDYETANKYDLKEITLDVVFGSLVFFWNLRKELQNSILNYLEDHQEEESLQDLKDSLKNMDGTNQFMDLQMETLKK